ncbi:MAG: VanZ family protein [Armatimonadetes bacterium]|nr:VanZ family protein [Armatimonadota bacterium]
MSHRMLLWLLAILWMLAIFLFSSFSTLPEPPGIRMSDKAKHFLAYAVLAWLLQRAVRGTWRSWGKFTVAAAAVSISAVYGITDEVHQLFVPNRYCDLLDWIADLLGSIAGVLPILAAGKLKLKL